MKNIEGVQVTAKDMQAVVKILSLLSHDQKVFAPLRKKYLDIITKKNKHATKYIDNNWLVDDRNAWCPITYYKGVYYIYQTSLKKIQVKEKQEFDYPEETRWVIWQPQRIQTEKLLEPGTN